MPCLITMSQKELHRLEAVQKVRDDRLSVSNAARLLSISRSHMHRLLQAYDLQACPLSRFARYGDRSSAQQLVTRTDRRTIEDRWRQSFESTPGGIYKPMAATSAGIPLIWLSARVLK
jgi:hypothetical protein